MGEDTARGMSVLGLAHVGDAVYELLVRTRLCELGYTGAAKLHRETVAKVNAVAQAKVVAKLLPHLTEAERAVFRRGRNTQVNSVPRGAPKADYHAATGLEALFGHLYLCGETERVQELFELGMEEAAEQN